MRLAAAPLALLALLAAPFALAQPPAAPDPCSAPPETAVDVASVKPSQIGFRSSHIRGTEDSITASGSVFLILESAYGLHDFQISNSPDWVHTATWDIVAKVDQPVAGWSNLHTKARGAIENQRMRAVLAQRFHLRCHFETRQLPVYNLVLAKGGPKLTPTPADAEKKDSLDEDSDGGQTKLQAKGAELSTLAEVLSFGVGRIILDKTGLTGRYDFNLNYAADPDLAPPAPATSEPSGPTLFTALEEQLGLKLESAKGPVPILVIDSVDRPSEN